MVFDPEGVGFPTNRNDPNFRAPFDDQQETPSTPEQLEKEKRLVEILDQLVDRFKPSETSSTDQEEDQHNTTR